jgi:hypothetical protein
MLYFCKPPDVVVGTHTDDQIGLDPVAKYGMSTFIVVDYNGPSPTLNPPLPPPDQSYIPGTGPEYRQPVMPTITPKILSDSVKVECRRRILTHVTEQAQRNITSHINDIQMARMTASPIRPATGPEQADLDTASAIWDWIGRPNGMQAASDALIAASDMEWYTDVKWPPWNSAWDTFVAQF